MSYPIKDKTKANKIKDDFEKDVDKLQAKTDSYLSVITGLRNKLIPQAVKDKLEDKRFGKEHAFEELVCNHTDMTRLKMLNCVRCRYNKREIEAETIVNSLTGSEQTDYTDMLGVTTQKTLSKLTIIRGSNDDVLGYQWEWN